MSLQAAMNSTMTRVQAFAVLALTVLLALGVVVVLLLGKMATVLPAGVPDRMAHGIETSWHSTMGAHRLWSVTRSEQDVKPWLEDHIAAAREAERLMPPIDGR